MTLRFEISWPWALVSALLALAIAGTYLFLARRSLSPHLRYSHLDPLLDKKRSLRVRLSSAPFVLKWVALSLFCLALGGPRLLQEVELPRDHSPSESIAEGSDKESLEEYPVPTEGVALYFVLDRSGSMSQEMAWVSEKGERRRRRRIDVLKEVTRRFIAGDPSRGLSGRRSDLVGLIAFARVSHVLSPLTLDHSTVLGKLDKLSPVLYREADGTAMGYALFKTANLIAATHHFSKELIGEGKPAYEIQSTAIILVTDGLHNPSPLDKDHPLRCMSVAQAAQHAGEHGIRVYIINVEPAVRYPPFALERAELQRAAECTGGRFYIADDPDSLLGVYAEIDQIERVVLPQERVYHARVRERVDRDPFKEVRVSELYPFLLAAALVCLLLSSILSATWLRRAL